MKEKKQKKLVKLGDLFQLGNHYLLCSDARNEKDIDRLIGNQKIQAIITDPPYGVNYTASKSGFKQKISKDKEIIGDQLQSDTQYKEFSKDWLKVVEKNLDKKNSIYIFNCDKMLFALKNALDDLNIYFSQLIIWVKSQAVIGRKDYLPQHELIVFAWKGTHSFYKSKDKSVLFAPKPSKSNYHPTIKPVSLIRKLILNSTRIGEIVYDPFAGSGTIMIASEQTKRKCLMVEIDPEYCQTIIDRYEKITKDKVIKIN